MVIGIPTVVNAMEHFWWKCRYSTKQEEFAISKAFLDKIPLFSHFKMSRTLERTVFVEEI